MSSDRSLIEALTSHEFNDVTGAIPVNVCDALFAIATAINRLASIQEHAQARTAMMDEKLEVMLSEVRLAKNRSRQ
jgi:hypothetical protein